MKKNQYEATMYLELSLDCSSKQRHVIKGLLDKKFQTEIEKGYYDLNFTTYGIFLMLDSSVEVTKTTEGKRVCDFPFKSEADIRSWISDLCSKTGAKLDEIEYTCRCKNRSGKIVEGFSYKCKED